MRNSKTLNLVSKDLTNIPETVFGDALYAEVTMIDFSQNKFQEIPAGYSSYIFSTKLTQVIHFYLQIEDCSFQTH